MSSIRPLLPLLVAAGILLAGNGLQGTLIALRGQAEGFSPGLIGLMGTAYFAGFFAGCVVITQMLRSVGHIRCFAALAALDASGTLMLVLGALGLALARPLGRALQRHERQRRAAALASTLGGSTARR